MSRVHFICGPPGAGKTTYAIALAQRTRAIRFCTEEWMSRLFHADRPHPVSREWTLERIERCETQMWTVADPIIARSIDVVFDLNPSSRDHRDRLRARVAQTRAESKLHYLDVGRATRRARLLERRREASPPNSLEVTDEMFDWMEACFEPPSDDELYGAMIVCEE